MNSLADRIVSQLARLAPFGGRTDDPLANAKTATRWLEELPVADAFKSQQSVLAALKRFEGGAEQFTRERLAIFMLLDEKSRDLQDTVAQQYLRNPRMSRQVESQLWHAVYGLYWELARGYHAFALYLARDTNRAQLDRILPLITLRAIRAFGQLIKWQAIRYVPTSDKLWQRLHKFYGIAEDAGYHRKTMRAYPDDAADSSCETAYLHILMLSLANSGSLYPKQIDQVDRWLHDWHDPLELGTEYDASAHHFVVDLSADHGPRRVRKPEPGKPLRFWSTAALLDKLDHIKAQLRETDGSPTAEALPIARTAENIELLEHLQRQWDTLATREQRRAPRAAVKLLIDVAHGLGSIISQIKMSGAPTPVSPYGTGLDSAQGDAVQIYGFIPDRTRERNSKIQVPMSPHLAEVERWVMEDESKFGYGATVESRDRDWLRVGALIGIKVHETEDWRLGVVRRLTRKNDDTSAVGIETLTETPSIAMLRPTATPGYTVNGVDNSGATLPHACLWLGGDDASVIIDPVLYGPNKVFEISGPAEHTVIALSQPLEHCEGWMRVRVQPVKR